MPWQGSGAKVVERRRRVRYEGRERACRRMRLEDYRMAVSGVTTQSVLTRSCSCNAFTGLLLLALLLRRAAPSARA